MKRIICLFIILSLLLNGIALLIDYKPVYALTTTANLTAAGSQVVTAPNSSYSGGAVDFTNLQTDDGDTSYLMFREFATGGEKEVCYDMTSFVASYDTIDSVTIYYKAKAQSYVFGYTERPYIRIDGTNYYGTAAVGMLNTYQTFSNTWTANPSGGSWNSTSLNAAEYGVAGYFTHTTYFYMVVTYTSQTVPVVTTQSTSNVIYSGGSHYALLNGNITSNGGNATDIRGFVYGTSSVVANPGNVAPPASGYSTNSTTYSSVIGAYTENITGMAAGTTYYVRAVAHNGIGWAYGDQVSFSTITNPTASTLPATLTSNSTSVLNGQVTFDGNASCNISFGWGLISGTWAGYVVKTNVVGTFTTGNFTSLPLSSLNASSTYYYNVQIQNSYGVAYGSEGNFTTASGINPPSSITAIPYSNQISVSWVKDGASQTKVMYSSGSYPTAPGLGTQAYLGTSTSCIISGLIEGTTYYISVWGASGGIYSTTYAYVLATTLAYSTTNTTLINTSATSPSSWLQTPDSSGININKINPLIAMNAVAYGMTETNIWFIIWIFASVGIGAITYGRGNGNIMITILAMAAILFVGTVSKVMGLEVVGLFLGFGISITVITARY